MYINSKKGITEVTSFVLIMLLVVTVSIIAYFALTEVLDKNIALFDRNNMEINIKKMDIKINQISTFENSSSTLPVEFMVGEMRFYNNQVYYQSLISYEDSEHLCFNNICYYGESGYERIYYNLSDSYLFNQNITLLPGQYFLIFTHNKNASKINIEFR